MVLQQYQQRITNLEKENKQKDELIESSNEMIRIYILDTENEGNYVRELEKEMKHLKAHAAAEAKRHLEIKRKLFEDFQKELKKFKKQLHRYKGVTNLELRLKDTIITKIKENMDRFYLETKTLKTVM